MTRRRGAAVLVVVVVCSTALAGCRNVRGVARARQAVEEAGYRDVDVSFGSGGGVDVVKVDAFRPDGAPDPVAVAGAVWGSLPLRFDRMRVAVSGPSGTATAVYDHDQLRARFGPREPGLDRRQVGDAVVTSGLKLFLALSVAALLSVALVVAMTLAVVRAARGQRRRAADGDDQAGAEPSDVLGVPDEAEGPEAIPS